MKKARIFAAFIGTALSSLPMAAMAATVSGSGSGSVSVGGLDLTGLLSNVIGTVTGLLGSGTGLLSGLGL